GGLRDRGVREDGDRGVRHQLVGAVGRGLGRAAPRVRSHAAEPGAQRRRVVVVAGELLLVEQVLLRHHADDQALPVHHRQRAHPVSHQGSDDVLEAGVLGHRGRFGRHDVTDDGAAHAVPLPPEPGGPATRRKASGPRATPDACRPPGRVVRSHRLLPTTVRLATPFSVVPYVPRRPDPRTASRGRRLRGCGTSVSAGGTRGPERPDRGGDRSDGSGNRRSAWGSERSWSGSTGPRRRWTPSCGRPAERNGGTTGCPWGAPT